MRWCCRFATPVIMGYPFGACRFGVLIRYYAPPPLKPWIVNLRFRAYVCACVKAVRVRTRARVHACLQA